MIWLIPGGVKGDTDISKSPVTFDVLAVEGREIPFIRREVQTSLLALFL